MNKRSITIKHPNGSMNVGFYPGTHSSDIRDAVLSRLGHPTNTPIFFVDSEGHDVVLSSAMPDQLVLQAQVAVPGMAPASGGHLVANGKSHSPSKPKASASKLENAIPFAVVAFFGILAVVTAILLPDYIPQEMIEVGKGKSARKMAAGELEMWRWLCLRARKPLIDAFVAACVWGTTYLSIRRWGNPETRPKWATYQVDCCYGMLASGTSVLLKELAKSYTPKY
ncbi:unnamed protein product [Chrysoparadoxa australica]